jgi:integrase
MSIYKREGHWHFTKTINGERYRGALKTARTKVQAEEAERSILLEIHSGTYRRNPNADRTLREFVERTFEPWTKVSKKSWRNDVSRLKPIVEFFGRYRLREITPFLVESFKAKRRKAPVIYKKKTATGVYEYSEKPRSAAAVNRELQLLSRIFSLADVENPCCKVDLLKGEKKRKRYLLPEERERLIQALAMPGREWLARIILVGLYTGLRRNELLGLRGEHIDFANNLIYVAGVKSELDAGTKTEEDRDVYMNPRVKAIVCDQMTLAKANG